MKKFYISFKQSDVKTVRHYFLLGVSIFHLCAPHLSVLSSGNAFVPFLPRSLSLSPPLLLTALLSPLRSLQRNLLQGDGTLSKEDSSPVTIADFAVQALVIHCLSECFPSDKFIAEESSELLKDNKVCIHLCICNYSYILIFI